MSTNVSGPVSWTTPVTIASGAVVASADLNNLNKDVAFQYAKPWAFAYMKSGATISPGANSQYALYSNTTSFAFSSSSSANSIGDPRSNSGYFTLPQNIGGVYRVTANVVVNSQSPAGYFRMIVGAGQNVSSASWTQLYASPWQITSNAVPQGINFQTLVPLNQPTGSNNNYIQIFVQAANNSVTVAGTPNQPTSFTTSPAYNADPSSTPPVYNTYAFVEYTGTSMGSY